MDKNTEKIIILTLAFITAVSTFFLPMSLVTFIISNVIYGMLIMNWFNNDLPPAPTPQELPELQPPVPVVNKLTVAYYSTIPTGTVLTDLYGNKFETTKEEIITTNNTTKMLYEETKKRTCQCTKCQDNLNDLYSIYQIPKEEKKVKYELRKKNNTKTRR